MKFTKNLIKKKVVVLASHMLYYTCTIVTTLFLLLLEELPISPSYTLFDFSSDPSSCFIPSWSHQENKSLRLESSWLLLYNNMPYLVVMQPLYFVLIKIRIYLLVVIEEVLTMIILMPRMGRNAGKLVQDA